MSEIENLQSAIRALEAQRPTLGDAVVDAALVPLRARMAELQPAPAAEQRRTVTVLFSDLVSFTAMASSMDPEDVREIVNAYFTSWTAVIEKWGGVVEKFIGDAVMAVFGLSQAREDDPERAVHAALEMCAALDQLNIELQSRWGILLAMRVGVHTGPVMVSFLGERRGQDFVAVGDTVNLASRIQSAAPPGGVLLSHDTYRHVRGVFEIRSLEPILVKGKPDPILVYQALRAKRRAFRTASRGVEGLETALVGRTAELSALQDAFRTSSQGGKLRQVTVVGEAGVGKSRLIAEFESWLELLSERITYFRGRASSAMQHNPFFMLRDLFSFRFEILDSDPPAAVQKKFEQGFSSLASPAQGGPAPAAALSPLPDSHAAAAWLGFPLDTSPGLAAARQDPPLFQNRALAALTAFFQQAAAVRPVVILLEDLHWADDSSLDALQSLATRLLDQPLLLVCTARPALFERRPNWGECPQPGEETCQRIDLQPFSAQESQKFVGELLRKAAEIPENLRSRIIESAEGNPFFMEELVNMLIGSGVIQTGDEVWKIDLSRMNDAQIPTTLTGLLQARLDSLPPEGQALLQRAAVVGRVFWDAAIAGQQGSLESSEKSQLDQLADHAMIYPNRSSTFDGTHEYLFKHALLRDVTYESILKRQRRLYHAHAAAWLQEATGRGGRSDEWAALIADHWDRAGSEKNAAEWYRRAGVYAYNQYANAEGIRCLTRCLELWPADDLAGRFDIVLQRVRIYDVVADRASQREGIDTLQALADQLQAGSAPCAERAWSAEVKLQEWHYLEVTGDFDAAYRTAEEGVALARECGVAEAEAQASLYAGATAWRRSDLLVSRRHLEHSLAMARQGGFRNIEADSLRNLGIVSQYQEDAVSAQSCYTQALAMYEELGDERGQSMLLNSLGILAQESRRWDEAAQYFERSLRIKRKIGHKRAIRITLLNQSILYVMLRRFDDARRSIESVYQSAVDDQDRETQGDALMVLGNINMQIGRFQDASQHMEAALAIYREIGSPLGESEALINLSTIAYRLGDFSAALTNAQAALETAAGSELANEAALAQTRIANALLAQDEIPAAQEMFSLSLDAFRGLGEHPGILTSLDGLARTHLASAAIPATLAAVNEILSLLTPGAEPTATDFRSLDLNGLDSPFYLLHTCLAVLREANDPRAAALLQRTRELLREQAARLENEADRQVYLSIPIHQQLLSLSF